jgi:hypothetical protein
MIDDQQVGKFLEGADTATTLDWHDLADEFTDEDLKVIFGTLYKDGSITYQESSLSLLAGT